MRAIEFIRDLETDLPEGIVWSRKGNSLVMKWRCETGARKNRIVPTAAACGQAKDMKKSAKMKKTRARTKTQQARRTKKTKRINPASRTLKLLNKFKNQRLKVSKGPKKRVPTKPKPRKMSTAPKPKSKKKK